MPLVLNHLDLPVPDLAATRDFFENFCGFTTVLTKGRDGLSVLTDQAGFTLVLSRSGETPCYPATFHIGFLLDGEAAVRTLHQKFSEGGVEAVSPLGSMRGGLMFYCRAPGGILVEVGWRP